MIEERSGIGGHIAPFSFYAGYFDVPGRLDEVVVSTQSEQVSQVVPVHSVKEI